MIKLVFVFVVFCAVIAKTKSDGYRPYGPMPMQGYTRNKRVKYSNPQRFYSRPPVSFPNTGVFSYTPPPSYMDTDEPPNNPGNQYPSSRPKVSKRPANHGLGDEDLQNFVKYLSKQDLDKILELAGQNRDGSKFSESYDKHIDYRPTSDEYKNVYNSIDNHEKYSKSNEDENKIFSALVKEVNLDTRFNHQEKNIKEYKNIASYVDSPLHGYQDKRPSDDNSSPAMYITDPRTLEQDNYRVNYVTEPTPLSAFYHYKAPLDTETTRIPINGPFTDEVMSEENLPRPVNLRDDQDFDVAFTNNVPVKSDPSYKVENFGDLPLMNYNSKLDTLSSYHVPHYTVTSSKSLSQAPSPSYTPSHPSRVPAVEPAPPSSAAKEQSDAHLKAVRIWSHKSTGTAYTLHDDGTLSLEKPGRPKGGYGYP